jgi:hypothetical protein
MRDATKELSDISFKHSFMSRFLSTKKVVLPLSLWLILMEESRADRLVHLRFHGTDHSRPYALAVLGIHCCEVFMIHTAAQELAWGTSRRRSISTHVISLSVVSNNSISTSLTIVARAWYSSEYAKFNPRHMRVPLPKGTKYRRWRSASGPDHLSGTKD